MSRKEFVTLLGQSGCGKTTTLRIIAGFIQPQTGDVFFDGKSELGVPPHKRPVNTVFQRYALFPHLNVFENIAFALRLKKVPEDEIIRRVMAYAPDIPCCVGWDGNKDPQSMVDRAIALSGSLVPQRFKALVDKFGSDPAAMKQAGIAYATDQIIDLFANNITNVHVYSMNKPDVAEKIQGNLSDILGK